MAERSLRPRRADDLGLRRALSGKLLPALVASMVFLAALGLAAAFAARGLAGRFEGGAAATLTIQVPLPADPAPASANAGGATRAEAAAALLKTLQGATVHRLTPDEIAVVLKPWLGDDTARLAFALPALFEVTGANDRAAALAAQLQTAAPGSMVERGDVWVDRLSILSDSLQACAAAGLLTVAFVAAAVIAVATRAGIASRRDAIEIVHGLGATDGMIAGQFAARVTALALAGAMLGLILALPVLLGLARLTAPFAMSASTGSGNLLEIMPAQLWALLPLLPAAAATIGWLTAQATVRSWLAGLA